MGSVGLAVSFVSFIISMITATAVDLATFGDIAALTNGIVLRRTDTITQNIWNIKTNLDMLKLLLLVVIWVTNQFDKL